jgi:hypothetical protein
MAKASGKNSGYGKTCSNRYGEFVAKETLDIVNTVLSNGAAVADVNMDFNRKTFENYCSSTENPIRK